MTRLLSEAIRTAAWAVAGVAAALALVQLLAGFGMTALFLALSATAAYAGVTEVGARRGPDPALAIPAQTVAAGVVEFFGVWALLAIAGRWAPRADAFLAATSFRSYAAVAVAGAFTLALLRRMLARRRPDLPGGLLVEAMTFWVSPFFGFFRPSVVAAMSLTGVGGASRGGEGIRIAVAMAFAGIAARWLADWFAAGQRPP